MREATIDNNINFFASDLGTLNSAHSTVRGSDPLRAAKSNSRDIDELFKRYQTLCSRLDSNLEPEPVIEDPSPSAEHPVPELLVADFAETHSDLREVMSPTSPIEEEEPAIIVIAHNRNLTEAQSLEQKVSSSLKAFPRHASVDSYNTADFTKLSVHTKQHQSSVLEEGLASALRIVLQLAKKLGGRDGHVDEGHLSQLEELHTVESVVDILKFIETDSDSLLLRCQRVQDLLLRSLSLFNGHPPSPRKQEEGDESLLSSEMCSPNAMSSTSENPVTSGVTA